MTLQVYFYRRNVVNYLTTFHWLFYFLFEHKAHIIVHELVSIILAIFKVMYISNISIGPM